MYDLVIVESPSKAKTLNKYLGNDYKVVASYGHVRDLPSKDGSVRPEEDFFIEYNLSDTGIKRIKEIADYAKSAKIIYLATDPDREGEAISWHIVEALKEKKKLTKNHIVKRIVFNEISKKAVLQAIANPRDLDMDLVNSQQGRRALDYLVGFNLSPVLWRKLPGSKSAGRVQSVALRLICERESEIEKFVSEEYWTIQAKFKTAKNELFTASLTHFSAKKLDKLSIKNEEQADSYMKEIKISDFSVADIVNKEQQRHPAAPFTTSSLQQEASRKLGFSAKQTMQIAQKLYEGVEINHETTGLITYMRTDSVHIAADAIRNICNLISKNFGAEYLPKSPRLYKTKAKNAQEAHEAIRPTDINFHPSQVRKFLDDKQAKLYELIWNRTVASQMQSAILDVMTVVIISKDEQIQFRASGSKIKFDGFYRLYKEDFDDEKDEEHKLLPEMKLEEKLALSNLEKFQHFTEASPRYSESSLIKKLEELGIGRPSTYVPIISVLQERDYVKLDRKRFIPEERGRLVTCFLENFFRKYIEYDFTANLENELDEISDGKLDWKKMLRDFWQNFHDDVSSAKNLDINHVIERLNEDLHDHLFPRANEDTDPTKCPTCHNKLSLRLGKFGAYISCESYPDCKYSRQIGDQDQDSPSQIFGENSVIGTMPGTKDEILLKKGPYGFYLQLGESEDKKKPKRVTIPKNIEIDKITESIAINLLSLPREIGVNSQSDKIMKASIGPYGPYILHDGKYHSVNQNYDILTISLEEAENLINNKPKEDVLRVIGNDPSSNQEIKVLKGRFGPFIKFAGSNIKIPKDVDYEEISLEETLDLIKKTEKTPKVSKKTKTKKT